MEQSPAGWVSPVYVDTLDVERIDLHTEFDGIDILLVIHQKRRPNPWVICIENKVEAKQGRNQLQRYYERVEKRFHSAERRIYIFLTKNEEQPNHPEYFACRYADIASELDRCIGERRDTIGQEPLVLLENYLRLIKEDFMPENENVQLAQEIYLKHKKALDFIFGNKIDPLFEVSNMIQNAISNRSDQLGVIPFRSYKNIVRFFPKEWNTPRNLSGSAWGENSPYVLCEVALFTKTIELHIVTGDAPENLADMIWERAAEPPFTQYFKTRPIRYIKPYKVRSNIVVSQLAEVDIESAEETFMAWLKSELESQNFRDAVGAIRELLDRSPKEN